MSIDTGSKGDALIEMLEEEVEHSRRPYAMKRQGLFWDFKYQDDTEELVCDELGHALFAQGKGDIRNIRKYRRPDDTDKEFPDCLADLDGKEIGIEVAELRDGMKFWEPWPLERFRNHVKKEIEDKNAAALILGRQAFVESLHQLYVVIPTDEPELPPSLIEDHMEHIRLPKPSHIDKAFVLVPRPAADEPVIRGQEYEPREFQPLCLAFEVQWTN